MIVGIGLDAVGVGRLERWARTEGLVARYFHPEEVRDARARGAGAAASLAARFAAKEAFGKALGTGLAGLRLRDIQVVNDPAGKPDLVLHGTALERFGRSGARVVHVSLAHEGDSAMAVVVIEG